MFNHAYWQYLILLVAELICSTRKGCHSGRSARSRSPNSCYSSTLSAGPTKYNAARATHEAMRAHHELPRTGLAELCHIHPSSPPQPVLSCSSADIFFHLLHAVGHFSNPIEKSSLYRGGVPNHGVAVISYDRGSTELPVPRVPKYGNSTAMRQQSSPGLFTARTTTSIPSYCQS